MDRQPSSMRRSLIMLMRQAVWSAMIVFGGMALLRLTPGPVAAAIAALLAFAAAVGIAMYLVEKRAASRG